MREKKKKKYLLFYLVSPKINKTNTDLVGVINIFCETFFFVRKFSPMSLTFSPTKNLGLLSRIRFYLEVAELSCGRCAKSFPNVSTEFRTMFLEHCAQWLRAPGTAARSVE